MTFRPLDDAEIEWYLASGEWEGRAGGYAIQGRGGALVERIDGDYLNVVGLPVVTLLRPLAGPARDRRRASARSDRAPTGRERRVRRLHRARPDRGFAGDFAPRHCTHSGRGPTRGRPIHWPRGRRAPQRRRRGRGAVVLSLWASSATSPASVAATWRSTSARRTRSSTSVGAASCCPSRASSRSTRAPARCTRSASRPSGCSAARRARSRRSGR